MKITLGTFLSALFYLASVSCQINTGNNVAPGLMECYNNSAIQGITIADERPPASMNMLIEFIQKLEDANPTMSPAQLSYQIMQRLRQNGITRAERLVDERIGIPFASSRLERFKFRVLLEELLPNVEQSLNYGKLTSIQRCSLHYMISNTIDESKRDNEALECSRSSRYTSRIVQRRRRDIERKEDLNEDTELATSDVLLGSFGAGLARNMSQCPIELGVVYSQFGAIKAGDVLAGIAAGLNSQFIRNSLVDNRYAATLVGELCEASLYQARTNVALGASGVWNSTISPKYFFLQNTNNLQATDAELRGGLDGLYMALKMKEWTTSFSDLKVSQILDMYYSPYEKGVFNSSLKACNRNILYTELISKETMTTQLYNFMPVLNHAALAGISVTNEQSFQILTDAGINSFETYLPKLASNDLSCTGTQTIERISTNLLVYIDFSWSFQTAQSVISYLLNTIDVNKFGTRYTLYSGTSLRNITNQETSFLSDFYEQYNSTVHANETPGFDYIRVFQEIERLGSEKLNNNSYTAGESTIVLLIPRTTLNDEQRSFVSQKRDFIRRILPDINFLVLGSGSQSDYNAILPNTNNGFISLQETTNEETIKSFGLQVVRSIKEVPRAIVNPSCTSQFTGEVNRFSLTGYVEPQGFNYYRISPNYFATGVEGRNLRIREQGYGTINVCISRDNRKPDNTTGTCKTISSADFSIDITNYCQGTSVESCAPIFFSVFGSSTLRRCRETVCRFPDDIKYTVSLENVGCSSGSIMQTASAVLVFLLCILLS